ncbi:cytidine and dCMP deaminase domain-containing protein 1-like isoform X2 [Xenia sp. Carnegie-2017]|uniref:cytidine and dCMP deaminase domain-containing protein 1-like isoform X2 n=1 Tax=Xenia sp. Carnegie-2017 TaxID=2897299 RepID=UPI001F0442C5|nr:cytidine and dCMP deaminase domain-containing protein 1-like isoform X2 [Xenia sp. Carnegie-2017]
MASDNTKSSDVSYADNAPRISKDDLFMIIALWMQDFVTHEEAEIDENINQVGAVLVSADDKIYAADCSREGVHAVARLLIKHPEKMKGSKIFMSRKPCSFCAKLLVQSKIQRVLYLPFYPEYYARNNENEMDKLARNNENEMDKLARNNENEMDKLARNNENKMEEVDELFKSSSIASSLFVFKIEENVLIHENINNDPSMVSDHISFLEKKFKLDQWKSGWLKEESGKMKRELPWRIFDSNIGAEVEKRFNDAIKWMARVIAASGRSLKDEFLMCPLLPQNKNASSSSETHPFSNFDPTKEKDRQKANHLMILASFLTQRTDDPKTGVGAVIVNSKMDILSFGWNGFPQKARYGEFGRGSNHDKGVKSKLPYVIHAEQNALLMRNCHNVKDAILFVTKQPCNECTPLLAMEGITTVVVGDEVKEDLPQKALGYDMFPKMVKNGKFSCFESTLSRKHKPMTE